MPSILFVCTANRFRSPLTAAFLLKLIASHPSDEEWCVESAGTWTEPGLLASSFAVKVAKQLDLPGLKEHRTRQVSEELLDKYDLILVMETGQLEALASEFHSVAGRLMLLSQVVDGISYDIPDPVDAVNDPKEVASELQMLVEEGGQKILDLAVSHHRARQIHSESDS